MTDPNPILVEATRGDFLDRVHRGAWAVATADGGVIEGGGDVASLMLPRSAVKLLQALPLVESGAADRARLDDRRLALACASHQGSARHAEAVAAWLSELGLGEPALRCGAQPPELRAAREAMREAGLEPTQLHHNCSGKHAGFLTLALDLGADPERYLDPDAPTQRAVAEAFADATGAARPLSWAVDGCSAPNFAAPLSAIAAAFARVADAPAAFGGRRGAAAARLRDAMAAHPFEIAGAGRACTELTEAAAGRAVVKTGAEGCFTAILVERRLGVALKIDDGSTQAAECAIAALLARFGAVDARDPRVLRRVARPVRTQRGAEVGRLRPTAALGR